MNSIYLVMEYYWNGESWEDWEENDTPIRAFESKEEAEEFIKTMPVPVKEKAYSGGQQCKCEELNMNKENGSWKRPNDEKSKVVLWKVEGAIRAFALRNQCYTDQSYAYYILEVPFGKEKEDET